MSRRRDLTRDGQIIYATTLDGEYRRRNLIRPSQFKKILAEKRSEYATVSFLWKGTKVHGFKPLLETQFEDLIGATDNNDDLTYGHQKNHLQGLTIGQHLADDR